MNQRALGIRSLLRIILIFSLYAFAHYAARIWLDRANSSVLWIPAGIGLAVLAATPRRWWMIYLPGFAAINVVYNAGRGVSLWDCAVFALSSSGEIVLAAMLLRRWLGAPGRFDRVTDALALVGVTAVAALVAGALCSALLQRFLTIGRPAFWANWVVGHYLAMLILGPLSLLFSAPGAARGRKSARRWLETALVFAAAAALTWTSFHYQTEQRTTITSPYVLFVVIVWSSIRLGLWETAACTFFITAAMIVTFRTDRAVSPVPNFRTSLESAQQFLAVLSTTGLVLAAFAEDRARAFLAAKQNERKNEVLLQTAMDGIHVHDLDGRIIQTNEAFCRLTGYDRDELARMNIGQIDARWSELELRAMHLRNVTRGAVFETQHRRKDGRLIDVEVSSTGFEVDGLPHLFCSARDITARKALEEQLRQSQKLEAVGRLAGGVAHDFNNILTGMMLNLQTLELQHPIPAELRPSIEELTGMVRRAASITEQLLIFARKNVMRSSALELNTVVAEAQALVRRLLGEDIAVELALAPDPLPVQGDLGMLHQVLLNMSLNARDAMPGGGRLRFATEAADLGSRGRVAALTISDTGSGIAADVMPRIFEPFFTTKDVGKGTGLGLAIVHSIVKQHDGWITVESAPGQGTAFRICLPLGRGEEPAPAPRGKSAVPGGSERILLVEDELQVRKATTTLLRRLGYAVDEAESIPDALAVWERHGPQIDLLITDMMMPGGMTGLQLAGKLAGSKPSLRVLIISGYNDQIMSSDEFEGVGFSFLAKPFELQTLALKLRQILGGANRSG